ARAERAVEPGTTSAREERFARRIARTAAQLRPCAPMLRRIVESRASPRFIAILGVQSGASSAIRAAIILTQSTRRLSPRPRPLSLPSRA
ncbi:MAG: hypothetical protein J0H20_01190, partial [Rhizobiales bacterium]|nr:hypothetical protein [Hyphomicrobiales bacterium]